ncbi:hypothetical protein MU852_13490 [Brevundimonas albigilva]|uniref:Lipoprotein n=1 Tax=Brevundimonas albigilva TaxID=1312364 RepID=A0ABY4SH01_9CAUL|nr:MULTISPECIES: hypothetical protein [Brevundimonas]UQV17814.1 hypothetical protein MU852_13490 [Brevundimonas albigilva]URI14277.1 hypothetical protein M8231_10625 [Brevundimonas albigilva]
MGDRRPVKRAAIARASLGLAGAASLAACAGTVAPSVSTAGMPGALEPVHAAAFTRNEAIFWVSSNGCTRKEDLIPIVTIQGGDAVITLRRLDEDKCRDPEVDGVEVKWSFEELGLAPGQAVSVNNPYQLPQT